MTDAVKREACRQFFQKWHGKGKEDEDDRSYWLDILQRIMGADDATDRVEFQKKVVVDGNVKRIDAYIPETKVLIEQKSLGITLDKKIHQSGGVDLTPYEQAKRYNDNLPLSEKAKWIVISNFDEIWIYDMDTKIPEASVIKIGIKELQDNYFVLDFLLEKQVKQVSTELELSLKAGKLVGKIYDCFYHQYHNPDSKEAQESLNILCVRLVFCLYAEDAGLFGSADAFSNYLQQYEPKDMRQALILLFKVLDTKYEFRPDLYLSDELEKFPYVNGGLFSKEEIIIPKFTQVIKDTLLEASHFSWRKISPTIFGAVFESTLNPETRRSGGMHYTSTEIIHKVIDPLFLDDLKAELKSILDIKVDKQREKKLTAFVDKLSKLNFYDPACGSGNFLTETYLSLRRLENQCLDALHYGQVAFGDQNNNPIKVSISQFYGIEINDFAADVAKTALWIAEAQMMQETESIVRIPLDFFPLETNSNIKKGNSLTEKWENIVIPQNLSYIIGNPPFSGGMKSKNGEEEEEKGKKKDDKKADMKAVIGKDTYGVGEMDYVAAWFFKASDYIQNTNIKCAFVSTNSIVQGQQAITIWEPLVTKKNIVINFGYRTFKWDSEATDAAVVHCVIVGFSTCKTGKRILFDEEGRAREVNHINSYLVDAPDWFVKPRKEPLCSEAPPMKFGSMPRGKAFIMTKEERDEIISKYPYADEYIKPFSMGKEFIDGKMRYCLWLLGKNPDGYKKCTPIMNRIDEIRKARLESTAKETRKLADSPTVFAQIAQPDIDYIAVPAVSTQRRRYIPIGFLSKDVIAGNKLYIVPGGNLYHFGILTSNVHMSWMRLLAGRMKSDYSYAKDIVYNCFPWPTPTDAQRKKIEDTAQKILDARAKYSTWTLASLYDPRYMPKELSNAHIANNKAVMAAYGLNVGETSEDDCVKFLMDKYFSLIK